MFNQSRSTIDQSNLQEAIDAASNATQKGGAQYFTPTPSSPTAIA